METLEFATTINAPAKTVWDTITEPDTYREWTGVAWPDSHFEGKWKTGEEMRFVSNDGSGTLARFNLVQPYEIVKAEHIGILGPGGTVEKTGDMAESWIGTTENYYLRENSGHTHLRVEIRTFPQYTEMFNAGCPQALNALRRISERQASLT